MTQPPSLVEVFILVTGIITVISLALIIMGFLFEALRWLGKAITHVFRRRRV